MKWQWFQVHILDVLLLHTFALKSDLKIVSNTCWFNWVLNSLVPLLWSKIRNGFIWMFIELQMWLYCFGLIIWWKWYLICVLPPYMSCMNVLRWYMHIWDCVGCYCAINNRALDCRAVKVEGPFCANVVEVLAFKCA